MKNILLLLAFSLYLVLPGYSDIKFPRGTFTHTDLAAAKEEATSSNKRIAYIYTDKKSNCGLCVNATEDFIKAVRTKAVIVYLDTKQSKQYWATLPRTLHAPLNAGRFIPKLTVTEADGETVLASLGYDDYKKDSKKAIRALKAKL